MPQGINSAGFVLHPVVVLAMATDCIPCHFRWEEKHALPHLPPQDRERIMEEHDQLRRAGYPSRAVIEHSDREMDVFRLYLPAAMVREIERDHQRFMPVLDAFALNGLPVPPVRIALTEDEATCCGECHADQPRFRS